MAKPGTTRRRLLGAAASILFLRLTPVRAEPVGVNSDSIHLPTVPRPSARMAPAHVYCHCLGPARSRGNGSKRTDGRASVPRAKAPLHWPLTMGKERSASEMSKKRV